MTDVWESLKRQQLGRTLSAQEEAFASALEGIYSQKIHDFEAVCQALTQNKITAPLSQKSTWTPALLEQELKALNDNLDAAYSENGRYIGQANGT